MYTYKTWESLYTGITIWRGLWPHFVQASANDVMVASPDCLIGYQQGLITICPSESNMLVPHSILDQFARIPHHTTLKNRYYGVFNSHQSDPHRPSFFHRATLFSRLSVSLLSTRTLLLPMLSKWTSNPSSSLKSNLSILTTSIVELMQMHRWGSDFDELFPTPRLYGISVMGEKTCILLLGQIRRSCKSRVCCTVQLICISDTVPAERWDTDITTEGYQRFMAVIDDVKEMAAALWSEYCVPNLLLATSGASWTTETHHGYVFNWNPMSGNHWWYYYFTLGLDEHDGLGELFPVTQGGDFLVTLITCI